MDTIKKVRDQFLLAIISSVGIAGTVHAQGLSTTGWKGCVKKQIEKEIKNSTYPDLKLTDIMDKFEGHRYFFKAIDEANNQFHGFIDETVQTVNKVISEDPRTGARKTATYVSCSADSAEVERTVMHLSFYNFLVDGEEPYFQIQNVNNTPIYSSMRPVNYEQFVDTETAC